MLARDKTWAHLFHAQENEMRNSTPHGSTPVMLGAVLWVLCHDVGTLMLLCVWRRKNGAAKGGNEIKGVVVPIGQFNLW